MLAPTRRLAIRRSGPLAARRLLRFRSAQSPRFQETRIGRWLRRTRRPTRAASERTPKSRPRRRERSRGNPPLPVRFTRRCSVSGTSRPAPKSRSRPSAQPRRAGTGDRAWSEAPSRVHPKAPAWRSTIHAHRRLAPTTRRSVATPPNRGPNQRATHGTAALSGCLRRTSRCASRRSRTARRTVPHPKVEERLVAPVTHLSKLKHTTGLGPDRHRSIEKAGTEVPPTTRRPSCRRERRGRGGCRAGRPVRDDLPTSPPQCCHSGKSRAAASRSPPRAR